MLPFYKKYARTFFDLFLLGLTVYLCMLLGSFLFNLATPIFVGLFIYLINKPMIEFLCKKGLKRNLATNITIFSFISIILLSIFLFGVIIVNQIQHLSDVTPKYIEMFSSKFGHNLDDIQSKYEKLSDEQVEKYKEALTSIAKKGSTLASSFFLGILGTISSVSTIVINFVLGLILAYFLSLEITSWRTFAKKNTPKTFKFVFHFLKKHVITGISKYIKAQLILIACSFVIVLIAFLIMGIRNAFVLSLFAAVLDLLPLVGMPVLIFPWAIYCFIVGNKVLGISLLSLWGVVFIFRQIAEPKIAGDSLGVSAFTMLSFMIISLSVFGVAGMILSPLLLILLKALYEEGYLSKWIHLPKDEFESEETTEINEEIKKDE